MEDYKIKAQELVKKLNEASDAYYGGGVAQAPFARRAGNLHMNVVGSGIGRNLYAVCL